MITDLYPGSEIEENGIAEDWSKIPENYCRCCKNQISKWEGEFTQVESSGYYSCVIHYLPKYYCKTCAEVKAGFIRKDIPLCVESYSRKRGSFLEDVYEFSDGSIAVSSEANRR